MTITTVFENIFEIFLHELISKILSNVYCKWFWKYYVSNLRRHNGNGRFKNKISRNSWYFRRSISPLENYRSLVFFREAPFIPCLGLIYWKKKSKIIIFETAIEGRKTKKSGCGSNTWNFWLFPDLLRTYRKKKISKRSNNSRPRIKIFKMSPSRSRSDTYFGSYRWLQNLWRWWFLPRPCLVKLCHLVISIYITTLLS